jgi:hypothetical protein
MPFFDTRRFGFAKKRYYSEFTLRHDEMKRTGPDATTQDTFLNDLRTIQTTNRYLWLLRLLIGFVHHDKVLARINSTGNSSETRTVQIITGGTVYLRLG